MDCANTIFTAASQRWAEAQPLSLPPSIPIVLWQVATRTIHVDDTFGPAVPYGPIPRTTSDSNFGYVKLKGNLDLADSVPELTAWPKYRRFVREINLDSTPIESVGCAIGLSIVDDNPSIAHRVSSYLDIVFSEPGASQNPMAYLRLAAEFMAVAAGCEKWWGSIEIGLQRLRHFPGTTNPLGVVLQLSGYGRNEREAHMCYEATLDRIRYAIPGLSHGAAI